MTREEFAKLVKENIVILDGATGTNLMAEGMPMGVCTEKWVLEHPDVITKLQSAYVEAGSDIIYASTFTANRVKLADYNLDNQTEEINRQLVELSKKAAGGKAYVAADMSMTGQQLYPMGDMEFEELVDVYAHQARILDEAGVDLYIVETMMSLQETRAAVLGIRKSSSLPIMVTMTFEANGRTLYGTSAGVAAIVLSHMDIDAIGVNCSTGPQEMAQMVAEIARYTQLPVIAKPNAGIPEVVDGKSTYKMTPEDFAKAGEELVKAGAGILGGCCGTRPEHIRLLKEMTGQAKKAATVNQAEDKVYLTTEREIFEFADLPDIEIGRPDLSDIDPEDVADEAFDLLDDGADVINVSTDDLEKMKEFVFELKSTCNCPLAFQSNKTEALEAGLMEFPGRAIVLKEGTAIDENELIEIAEKYGAIVL